MHADEKERIQRLKMARSNKERISCQVGGQVEASERNTFLGRTPMNEYLFARFAWHVLQEHQDFLSASPERRLVCDDDQGIQQEILADAAKFKALFAPQRRTTTPSKSRSPKRPHSQVDQRDHCSEEEFSCSRGSKRRWDDDSEFESQSAHFGYDDDVPLKRRRTTRIEDYLDAFCNDNRSNDSDDNNNDNDDNDENGIWFVDRPQRGRTRFRPPV